MDGFVQVVDNDRRVACVAAGADYLKDVIDDVLLRTVQSLITFVPPSTGGGGLDRSIGRASSFPLPVPDMPPTLAGLFSLSLPDWSRLRAIEVRDQTQSCVACDRCARTWLSRCRAWAGVFPPPHRFPPPPHTLTTHLWYRHSSLAHDFCAAVFPPLSSSPRHPFALVIHTLLCCAMRTVF